YFSISSVDEVPTFGHAAKKHRYSDPPQIAQLAWLIRAEQAAKKIQAQPFSLGELKRAMKELRGCLKSVEDLRRVPDIVAKAGVRLVIVEFLPGAKLDGACFWVQDGRSPVVALSLRLDRLDNF